ncbi:MAG: hypothetical protein ACNA8N_05125 [Trueperaceae bacterium]
MYGLIGKIRAVASARDALVAILSAGFSECFETRPVGGHGLGTAA